MFCGFLSVTFSVKGSLTVAAWLIVSCGVLDAVDGPVARALQSDSAFGGQLDSFSDLVSFGLAPSLLFYRAYFMGWGIPGLALSFLPTVVSAIRLARFNTMDKAHKRDYFIGFTTTASACLLASFLLFCDDLWGSRVFPDVAAALVLLSSALMLSKLHYITVAKFTSDGWWRTPKGVLCLAVGVAIVLFPSRAFFPAMMALMLEGLLSPGIGQVVHHFGDIQRQHRGV